MNPTLKRALTNYKSDFDFYSPTEQTDPCDFCKNLNCMYKHAIKDCIDDCDCGELCKENITCIKVTAL